MMWNRKTLTIVRIPLFIRIRDTYRLDDMIPVASSFLSMHTYSLLSFEFKPELTNDPTSSAAPHDIW